MILVKVWVDKGENNNLPLCRSPLQYVLAMPRTMLSCPHIAPRRDGSRNFEGVYITCRHVGNNFVVVATATAKGGGKRSVRAKRGKFFRLHFSVVLIGSRSTFVVCTALLTGRLSLSDVLEPARA